VEDERGNLNTGLPVAARVKKDTDFSCVDAARNVVSWFRHGNIFADRCWWQV
jgi:hypothetical protein